MLAIAAQSCDFWSDQEQLPVITKNGHLRERAAQRMKSANIVKNGRQFTSICRLCADTKKVTSFLNKTLPSAPTQCSVPAKSAKVVNTFRGEVRFHCVRYDLYGIKDKKTGLFADIVYVQISR